MENIEKWRNLIESATWRHAHHFKKGDEIDDGLFQAINVMSRGLKRAVIIFWKMKAEPIIGSVPGIEDDWRQLFKYVEFGKETVYRPGREMSLASAFGLPSCVGKVSLTFKEGILFVLLAGENLTTGEE